MLAVFIENRYSTLPCQGICDDLYHFVSNALNDLLTNFSHSLSNRLTLLYLYVVYLFFLLYSSLSSKLSNCAAVSSKCQPSERDNLVVNNKNDSASVSGLSVLKFQVEF